MSSWNHLFVFCLIFPISVVCQAQDGYPVTGSILLEDQTYANVEMIIRDRQTTRFVKVSPSGHFAIQLKWNDCYWLTFSKPGYVSKIIEFSTEIPKQQKRSIEPYHLQVRLFKVFEGVDSVFFKKPVAKVYFDQQLKDFKADREYALEVLRHIEEMRQRAEKAPPEISQHSSTNKPSKKNVKKNVEESSLKTSQPAQAIRFETKHETTFVKQENNSTSTHSPSWLPPLKPNYPEGRTVESFQSEGKNITRTIIRLANDYKVLLKVEHSWGGVFYFLDESPLVYRSVSKQLYEQLTLKEVVSNKQ